MVVSVLRRLLASPPRYLVLQEESFFILTGNAVDVCYFAPAETPRSTEQGIGERAVAGAAIRRMDPVKTSVEAFPLKPLINHVLVSDSEPVRSQAVLRCI